MACCLTIGGGIPCFGNRAIAQLKPISDNTLGTRVTPSGPSVYQIKGGVTRGANLFHSFQEFNVDNGQAVYFTNPAGIANILARVTGKNPSNILGTLGVQGGNANLFLMNPNGIIFGQNASLDVKGSFVATTANAIKLGDTGIFSASEPASSNLLSVQPSALFFNALSSQAIVSYANALGFSTNTNQYTLGLQVPDGQSLLLVGGNVSVDGGILQASGGRIELGGVAGAGTVGLSVDGNKLGLSFPQGVGRADVSLTRAFVDVTGSNGGDIAINARNLNILEGSLLSTGIRSGLDSVASQGGNITLNATGAVTIANSGINSLLYGAVDNGGDIRIQAESLSLTNGSKLEADTYGQANAGSISVQVEDAVLLANSGIYSTVGTGATGNGGNIRIQAGSLSLYGDPSLPNDTPLRAELRADTLGQGNAGSISVQVSGSLSLIGNSGIYSIVEPGGVGNGGNLDIQTGLLSLYGDPSLTHSAQLATGIAGLDNSGSPAGQGKGGDIRIQAESVSLAENALLSSETAGQGNAGSISVQAKDTVSVSNSFILSGLRPGAVGNGSDIHIHAKSVSLTDGGVLSASTGLGTQGNAGNIQIDTSDSVNISGVLAGRGASGGVFTTTENTAMGRAGNITVNTGALRISDGAVLSARTRSHFDGGNITVNVNTLEAIKGGQLFTTASSSGRAGNIAVNAANSVTLSGSDPTYPDRFAQYPDNVDTDGPASGLFARTEGAGAAGNLTIATGQLIVRDGAIVTSQSSGQGKAGDVSINVRGTLQANNGTISTSATQSSGGAIDITARDIRLFGDSDIKTNVASGAGNGGNINLTARSIIALGDSDILAYARDGRGGNITLKTPAFFGFRYRPTPRGTDPATLDGNNRVDINASGAVSGVITLPDTTIVQNSLGGLPANVIDTSNLIAKSCIARSSKQRGSFIITGAGGLPTRPDDLESSPFQTYSVPTSMSARADSRNLTPVSSTTPSRSRKQGNPIVEAQGIYRLPNGQLILSRECHRQQ